MMRPEYSAVKAKWAAKWANLRKDGVSLDRACAEIAADFGCASTTVRTFLDPAYGARERGRALRFYHRRQSKRRYERAYRRVTRPMSQERILHDLYARTDTLTLNEITEALTALPLVEGVRFQPPTIERRLLEGYLDHQAKGRIRGPPPYLVLVDPATRSWYFGNDPPASDR